MAENETQGKAKRDRSPSYPSINLGTAIDRLIAMDEHFKRHPAPVSKIGLAWGIKPASSQASSTVAALKSFGLVEYQGSGADLKATLTDEGRTYLRAQQDAIKQAILTQVVLKPKAIAKYYGEWGIPRPIDAVCLDELVLKGGFSQAGAETFLKVYDASIAYAKLGSSDSIINKEDDNHAGFEEKPIIEVGDLIQWESSGQLQFDQPKRVRAIQEHDGESWIFVDGSPTGIQMNEITLEHKGSKPTPPPPILAEGLGVVASEREWLRGPLSKDSNYRLIVSGNLGPKEIGKLIKLLEVQKAVLSDDDEEL